VALCAIGKSSEILKLTNDKFKATCFGNVFWYMNNDRDIQSFGFSDVEKINLSPHDLLEGEHRLSWNISGNTGGYRSGNNKNLTGDEF